MSTYSYCVNTFTESDFCLIPVQRNGVVEASDENNAIKILKDFGKIYPTGYEFIELKRIEE